MHLPTLAKPVLSRAGAVARVNARLAPQSQTAPRVRGCPQGFRQCGDVFHLGTIPMITCCDTASEFCHEGECIPRAAYMEMFGELTKRGMNQSTARDLALNGFR